MAAARPDMVTASGLTDLSSDLNPNLDAKVVSLTIGGNEFVQNLNACQRSVAEQKLFDSIVADIDMTANHIAIVRLDVHAVNVC